MPLQIIELSNEQRRQLQELLIAAFPSVGDLKMLTKLHIGKPLNNLVNTNQTLPLIIFELLEQVEAQGELLTLFRGIKRMRDNRPDLKEFFLEHFPQVLENVSANQLVQSTSHAVNTIVNQMQLPEVRETVGRFSESFESIESRINVLEGYKKLHDILHVLQRQLPNMVDATGRFPDDLAARRLLGRQMIALDKHVTRAEECAPDLPTSAIEQNWIADFRESVAFAREGFEAQDRDVVSDGVEEIRSYLIQANRIDGIMLAEVTQLPLERLIEALRVISQFMGESGTSSDSKTSLEAGQDALLQLHPQLRGLINQHSIWQQLDRALAGIETNQGFEPKDKIPRWRRERERLLGLCLAFPDEDWATDLTDTLADWEAAAAEQKQDECEVLADSLRARAMDRFFDVDVEMYNLCEVLLEIGKPIGTLLQILREING